MPLTNTAIRTAKPAKKARKLFDGGGLYIEVSPAGGKWWRFKYRFDDKEKRVSLGVYPDVPLKAARNKRDETRKLLAAGIDPSDNRKAVKAGRMESAANSLEVLAREWFAKFSTDWAPTHAGRIIRRFERDVFPWIGGRPIAARDRRLSRHVHGELRAALGTAGIRAPRRTALCPMGGR
jgi:hypothetical protein